MAIVDEEQGKLELDHPSRGSPGTTLSHRPRFAWHHPENSTSVLTQPVTNDAASSPSRPLPREDIVDRRDVQKVLDGLDHAKVLAIIGDYRGYTLGSSTLRNLPEFDCCDAHVVRNDAHATLSNLFQSEIDKLITFTRNEHNSFDSGGHLGATIKSSYEHLDGLVKQILVNLCIVQHENAKVIIESNHGQAEEAAGAWEILLRTRQILANTYRPDVNNGDIDGLAPTKLADAAANFEVYCALIDYICGTLVWWVVRSIHSPWLVHQVLAILAKWTVKLKLIAADPVSAAKQALDATDSLISNKNVEQQFTPEVYVVKTDSGEQEVNAFDAGTGLAVVCFGVKMRLRQILDVSISHMLKELAIRERSPNPVECFQSCAWIYHTGLHNVTTILTTERSGNVYISSDLKHINFGFSIHGLLGDLIGLQQKQSATSYNNTGEGVTVTLRKGNDRQQARIFGLDQLISVLAPLSLMGYGGANSADILHMMATVQTIAKDRVAIYEPPPRNFEMEFSVQTDTWNKSMRSTDSEILPLNSMPLRRSTTVFKSYLASDRDTVVETQPHGTSEAEQEMNKVFDRAMNKIRDWEICPSYVVVKCRTYVWTAATIAATLVLGGIAVPFTVHDRIRGVDPFQITLFSWIIGGFILYVAKGRYVAEWPWHDYLKGRVVCCTLSDLSDVSGLDCQLILRFLLLNEYRTLLNTSGPYNSMFNRKDPIGFSIDRPVEGRTMILAGFIILKVASAHGQNLIFLDGRKGASGLAMPRRSYNWIFCKNYDDDMLERYRDGGWKSERLPQTSVLFLNRKEFSWDRILGFYVGKAFFG